MVHYIEMKLSTLKDQIEKAWNYKREAEKQLESHVFYSEAIHNAQVGIELSTKAILSLLKIDYDQKHDLNEKHLEKLTNQIVNQRIIEKLEEHGLYNINLPRLLFLFDFWGKFYLVAKYGFETKQLASAKTLFKQEEAKLAVEHAQECCQAANDLLYRGEGLVKELNR